MKAVPMNLYPRISEKAMAGTASANYVFMVPLRSSKQAIAEAIEQQFSVTVADVRTALVKGKQKASNQKRKPAKQGVRQNFKKAYIRLAAGEIKIAEVG